MRGRVGGHEPVEGCDGLPNDPRSSAVIFGGAEILLEGFRRVHAESGFPIVKVRSIGTDDGLCVVCEGLRDEAALGLAVEFREVVAAGIGGRYASGRVEAKDAVEGMVLDVGNGLVVVVRLVPGFGAVDERVIGEVLAAGEAAPAADGIDLFGEGVGP